MLAGLLDALHNETPPSEPAMSPTNKLHAAYEPISEAELLADGLIEPVRPPTTPATQFHHLSPAAQSPGYGLSQYETEKLLAALSLSRPSSEAFAAQGQMGTRLLSDNGAWSLACAACR